MTEKQLLNLLVLDLKTKFTNKDITLEDRWKVFNDNSLGRYETIPFHLDCIESERLYQFNNHIFNWFIEVKNYQVSWDYLFKYNSIHFKLTQDEIINIKEELMKYWTGGIKYSSWYKYNESNNI